MRAKQKLKQFEKEDKALRKQAAKYGLLPSKTDLIHMALRMDAAKLVHHLGIKEKYRHVATELVENRLIRAYQMGLGRV